jgi:hypothetical protein
MATDLFGKPVGGHPELTLNLQQRRQATLLYHWMSLDYLKGLKAMIDALIKGVDVNLELAKQQGRDALIANERWGVRDTAANWSTHVFPALEDFRKSTTKLIAWRASEIYCGTGADQCAHMLDEHSSLWMTEAEEARFKAQFDAVYQYAQFIDFAAGIGGLRHQLHDFSMCDYWLEQAHLFRRLPKFRVRTDVEAVTGKPPQRTGVYVAQDDGFATLQFAWVGGNDGALGDAQTLNDAGRRAVAALGRDAAWTDGQAMAKYATDAFKRGELTDRGGFDPGDESNPRWVGSILSQLLRSSRPCKWYFVEQVQGEFDDAAELAESRGSESPGLRCDAGQPCPREGWWVTPAKTDSRRHFKHGEVMPSFTSDYGSTIWQWDENQA